MASRALRDATAVAGDDGDGADQGEVTVPSGDLVEPPAHAWIGQAPARLRDQFIAAKRCHQGPLEEIPRRNLPRPGATSHDDGPIEAEEQGGQLGGRVGVGDVPGHGAPVADGRVSDQPQGSGQQGMVARRPALETPLPNERTQAQGAVGGGEGVETWKAVDVDDRRRASEP